MRGGGGQGNGEASNGNETEELDEETGNAGEYGAKGGNTMGGRAGGVADAVTAGSNREGGHTGTVGVDSAMEDGSERARRGMVRFSGAAEEPSKTSEAIAESSEASDASSSSCRTRWGALGLPWLAEQSSWAKRSRSAAPGETVGSPKMASTSKT